LFTDGHLMKTLKEIKAQLEELKPVLRQRFQVETIGVFGSYSREEQKSKSDVDILVTFIEPNDIDLIDFIEIKQFLRRKLKIKVDLVKKSALKPIIREKILEETIYI
jgi:predicted nucleotidyltransferase